MKNIIPGDLVIVLCACVCVGGMRGGGHLLGVSCASVHLISVHETQLPQAVHRDNVFLLLLLFFWVLTHNIQYLYAG